jgi:micrococcal nuclease
MQPNYTYHAKVVRIVDGDTLDVDLDYGDRLHAIRRLRLSGVNTPEAKSEQGRTATAFVTTVLPVGTEVIVTTFKPDKFGRQLAVVHLPGGSDLATELLRRELATAYVGGR